MKENLQKKIQRAKLLIAKRNQAYRKNKFKLFLKYEKQLDTVVESSGMPKDRFMVRVYGHREFVKHSSI